MVNLLSSDGAEEISLLIVSHQLSKVHRIVEPLKEVGYQVLAAGRAEEVVAIMDYLTPPRLLIIDLTIDNLDPPELLEMLRLRFGRTGLPPVMLLAPDSSSESLAHDLQVEDYLPEPFAIEEFLIHVDQLLKSNADSTSGK